MSSALSLASIAQNISHGAEFSGSNTVYGDGNINQFGVVSGNVYLGEQATRSARKDFFTWMKQWTDHIDFRKDQGAIYSKRYKNTGDWMLRREEFEHWMNGHSSSLLWCWGSPGIGKSVLASIVVNHLQEIHSPNGVVAIAWAYFKHDFQESQTLATIFASFLKQLCIGRPDLPPHLLKFYQKFDEMMETPSIEEFAAEFESLGNSYGKVFIVVDALDECTHENQEAILKLLFAFANKHLYAKILVTSRDEKNIRELFSSQGTPVIHIQVDNITSDIRNYVDGHIHELLQEKKLFIESPALKEKVIDRLTTKSQGMFLWVNLQVYRLCKHRRDKDIEMELERLPEGLDKTYKRIIEQIGQLEPELQTLAQRSLIWIFHSARPLSINELAEAVAIDETCFTDKDLGRSIFSKDVILDSCSNLLVVEDNTVRPVHFSVLEYFRQATSKSLHILSSVADPDFGNNEIAVCCLRYLMLDIFWNHAETEEDLMNRVAENHLASYASFFFDIHIAKIDDLSSVLIEYIKRFLRYRNKSLKSVFQLRRFRGSSQVSDTHRVYVDIDYPIEPEDLIFSSKLHNSEQLIQADSKWERAIPPRYSLHRAVENGAVESVKSLIICGQSVNELDYYGLTPLLYACKNGFIDITAILLNSGAEFDTISKDHGNALYVASAQGYFAIVRVLIDYGVDVNAQSGLHSNALYAALYENHIAIAKLLLMNGATPDSTDESGRSALYLASSRGYTAIVRLLITSGVNINAQSGSHSNALCVALYKGYIDVAKLLLESGANPDSTDESGRSALYLASLRGYTAIVRFLVTSGANINAWSTSHNNALYAALYEGHVAIAELLLKSGATPHSTDGYGTSPLYLASSRGYIAIVRLLVTSGVEINAQSRLSSNALCAALYEGHITVAELLLKCGATPDSTDESGRSALYIASLRGYTAIVRLLITSGVEISTRSRPASSALCIALYKGHIDVAKLLLESGANPDSIDESGRSALYLASLRGYTAIVKLLVTSSTRINARCGFHGNALHAALYEGHIAIAELLLDYGAVPNSSNGYGTSALYLASSRGYDTIVFSLIRKNSTLFGVKRFPYQFEEAYSPAEVQEALEVAVRLGIATVTSVFAVHRPWAFEKMSLENEILNALERGHCSLTDVLLKFWIENVANRRTKGHALDLQLATALAFNQLSIAQRLFDFGAFEDKRLLHYSQFGFETSVRSLSGNNVLNPRPHFSKYRGFLRVLLDLEAKNTIKQIHREVFTIDDQIDQYTIGYPTDSAFTEVWYALTRLECYRSTDLLEWKPKAVEIEISEMCHIRQLINHIEVGSKPWDLEDFTALRSAIVPLQAAVAGVLDSMDFLKNHGFLTAALGYNILIHDPGMHEELIKIASIRKCHIETLNAWLVRIIHACSEPLIHLKAVYMIVQTLVLQCLRIFRHIGFDIYRGTIVFGNEAFEDFDSAFGGAGGMAFHLDHTDIENVTSIDFCLTRRIDIIEDCVYLLAFGLLLYVRSHISALVRPSQGGIHLLELSFHNIKLEEVNLASLERCFEGPVFVFSLLGGWSRKNPAQKVRLQTTIESFAELWGPIIEAYEGKYHKIQYIQLKHGYICRSNTQDALEQELNNLTSCCWEEHGERAFINPSLFNESDQLII